MRFYNLLVFVCVFARVLPFLALECDGTWDRFLLGKEVVEGDGAFFKVSNLLLSSTTSRASFCTIFSRRVKLSWLTRFARLSAVLKRL